TPTEPPAYTFSSLTAPYLHTFKQVIVNSQGCRDSITHTIVGSDKPTAAFTFSPSTTCAQFPVLFDGNGGAPGASGCPINDVVWSFGDSTVSYSRSLTANHIYSDTALAFPNGCSRFKPWLFVESNGCRSDTAHNGCVIINPAIAKFTVEQNCSNRMCITLHATDNLLAENNSAGSSFDWQITNVANGGLISVPNAPNQQVCFQTTGQYLVTLTVSDINSGCTQSATKTITIANPVASMTTSAMSGCAPLLLQFASTSTDTLNIATYAWTFSGAPAGAAPIILYSGTSSSNQGYSLFTTPGLYTTPITLTITDVNGCAFSTTTPNNVDVRGLIVDFIATPTSACAPATINLTSTSISLPVGSTIANTYWDFGNNSAPTLYDATGPTAALQVATASTNWVKLVVVNSLGCRDSLTRLTAAVYGTSAIFNTDTLRCTNQNLAFQNTSFGQSALTYNWSFPGANITSSSNRVPVGINYPTEGYYTVCLTVSQNNPIVCSSSICQQVHIADPHIAFTADTTVSYCPPALISFTNQSTNCTAYTWHIRDDTGAEISVSNFANMQYVFTNQGNYTVVLYGTTTSGCRDSLVRTSYIHISGPGGAYSFTPSSGCAPLDVEFTAFNLIGTDQVAIYGGDFDCAQPLQIFPVTNTTAIIHHIYHCAGIYNPVLYVQNATGCNRIIDFQMPVTVDTVSGGHVHPGDTNNDGVANNLDLLPIALYTGATGPARSPQNTQWTQSCLNELPWSGYIQNTTTNLKHVDCDGNGTILPNDTLAILQNYGRTHARQPLVVYTNVPTISCVFPSDTARNVTYPYTLQSSINVGDAANPATNIAGLAFTINYDRTLADSAYMSLSNFSWLGAPNELYHLQHDDGQGHLDVAISRFDGTTRNGFGQVAICNFVITDNIIGRGITGLSYPFNVSVSGIKAIDNQNIDKPMNGAAMHTVFTNMILNTVENSLSQRVHIFPNPLTTHRLNIHTENLVCTAIQISTMLGQVIFSDVNINKSQFIVDLPTLSAGVYIVEMTTNGERVMKKLVVGNIK
ncbi:MAG: hypothetical protein RI894_2023, partial [Bacteroidota bacterium]